VAFGIPVTLTNLLRRTFAWFTLEPFGMLATRRLYAEVCIHVAVALEDLFWRTVLGLAF